MKAMKFLMTCLLSLFIQTGFSQTTKNMEVIKINKDVSTHFIASEAIQYVDISMNEVVGEIPLPTLLKIKPSEEKIKVKTKCGFWSEEPKTFIDGQAMGVVTIVTERTMSQYMLVYTEIPEEACSEYRIPLTESSAYKNPDIKMSEKDMYKFAWTVWNEKQNYFDVRTKKDKMMFEMRNLFTIGDFFFIDLHLLNKANIKYDIDQIRFKISDKKQLKVTNSQDVEIHPVLQLFDTKDFTKEYRNVFVFEKFSFSDEKVLTVEISEKQYSSRTILLKIDYEDVLNADSFSKRFK